MSNATSDLQVREERPGDEADISRIHDLAFGQPAEGRLVAALRESGAAVVSLLATRHDCPVGHILFSPVTLSPSSPGWRAVGLAPMAVLPDLQRQGIGGALVRAGLERCGADWRAVVVLGHPDYYPRFDFVPASRYGLRCEYDVPDDVFMALELETGALGGVSGTVQYRPEFGQL